MKPVLLLALCALLAAQTHAKTQLAAAHELLRPDGSLNLHTGRPVSLDLTGYEVTLDPERGPLLSPAMMVPGWNAMGGGVSGTGSDHVYAIAIGDNGFVYVGGFFNNAGGIPANNIAIWDGVSWDTLSSGIQGVVSAIILHDNQVFASGSFNTAGGVSAINIAKWENGAWSSLGNGLYEPFGAGVRAMAIDTSGHLYAGGYITFSGSTPMNNICKWDGSQWLPVGDGLDGIVYDIIIGNDNYLYAGGSFNTSGGNPISKVAKWDGTAWSSLDYFPGGTAYDLTIDQEGNLLGGSNMVYKWNGVVWTEIGDLLGQITCITTDASDNIYAGGYFQSTNGSYSDVAKWNGLSWEPWGSDFLPVDGLTISKIEYDGGVNAYVGGYFTSVNGITVNSIARYELPPLTDVSATAILTPTQTCLGTSETIKIRVKNTGNQSLNFANDTLTVTATISGALTDTLTTTVTSGTLASGATLDVTLGTLDLSTPGEYIFNAHASIAGDGNPANDAMPTVTRFTPPTVAAPHTQNFNAAPALSDGWANVVSAWSVGPTHGLTGNGLFKNLKAGTTSAQVRSLAVGPLAGTEHLVFYARVLKAAGYPNGGGPAAGWGNLKISYSTDCGGSYTLLATFTDLAGAAWKAKELDLSGFGGEKLLLRFEANWTSGDWFVDIDNLRLESPTNAYFVDADGDGFGNPAQSVLALLAPTGYVLNNDDCNDDDPSINPGEAEICGNATDENCDAVVGLGDFTPVLTPSCSNPAGNSVAISNLVGGAAPLLFSKNGGATFGSNPVFSGLSAGTYTFVVLDNIGCTVSKSVVVQSLMSLATSKTNVLCNGQSTGSVSVSVAGGYAPLSYIWKKGSLTVGTTATVSGLGTGKYKVTVTDARGCTKSSGTVTISQPSAVSLALARTNVACFGESSGSIVTTVSGGTNPYSFAWSDGATTQNRSNLPAGNYGLTLTDGNGCAKLASTSISQPPNLVLGITKTDALCNGTATGSAIAVATGGTGGKTYLWNTGATSANLNNLPAGTYSVTATDANGCAKTSSTSITEPSAISLTFSQINPACYGTATGSATVTATGGTGNKTYLWSNGSTAKTASNLAAGTHTVSVTDAAACQVIGTATLTDPPLLQIDSITTVPGSASGKFHATVWASGGTGTKKYRRSTASGFTAAVTSNVFLNLTPGTYTFVAIDSKMCTDTMVQAIPALLAKPGTSTSAKTTRDFAAADTDFQLQPNPAHQSVRLIFSDGQIPTDGQLDITDAAGRVLRQIPLSALAASGGLLSLENLPPGVVTVVLRAEGQAPMSRKLVIF